MNNDGSLSYAILGSPFYVINIACEQICCYVSLEIRMSEDSLCPVS